MKISCNVVRDLLPLYAEDMVSGDSRALVDEHLSGCENCAKILEDVRHTEPIPADTSPETLIHVRKMIIRRRSLSVMASVFTLITLASLVITYLFTPFQLTMEQALDDFYIREDGAVLIDYSSAVVGRHLAGQGENWFINQYSTHYDMWKGNNRKTIEELYGTDGVITEEEKRRYENIDIVYGTWKSADGKVKSDAPIPWMEDAMQVTGGSDWNWWYADPSGLGKDILLYDAGQEKPLKEERFWYAAVYPILFFGGIVLILTQLILRRFAKKAWAKELITRFLILSVSLVFSTLFVSNGRIFTSYVGVIKQYWGWFIGMDTVFLTLTILFWRQLYLLNQKDKYVEA